MDFIVFVVPLFNIFYHFYIQEILLDITLKSDVIHSIDIVIFKFLKNLFNFLFTLNIRDVKILIIILMILNA